MRFSMLFATLAAAGVVSIAAPRTASADEPKNLEVLDASLGKKIGKGMKDLSKGLGVKCEACHIKGKMEADDKPAKDATRTFIKAALNADAKARKAALAALLKEMKLEREKDDKKVWSALDMWKKK